MRLEQVAVGVRVRGLDVDGPAEVMTVRWIGADALDVIYRFGASSRSRMLLRGDGGWFDLASAVAWSFARDCDNVLARAATKAKLGEFVEGLDTKRNLPTMETT